MTRVDMITKIAKSLRRRDTAITTNMVQCRFLAEIMLDASEKAGMVPPNQYACTNEFRFEWEEEDV